MSSLGKLSFAALTWLWLSNAAAAQSSARLFVYQQSGVVGTGLPADLCQALAKHRKSVASLAFEPAGGWVVIYGDGAVDRRLTTTELEQTLAALPAKSARQVAFTPEGGWLVLSGDHDFKASQIPSNCLSKLKELAANPKSRLRGAAFGPNSSWILTCNDSDFYSHGLPKGMQAKLQELRSAHHFPLKQTWLGPKGGWLLLWARTSNWGNLPDARPQMTLIGQAKFSIDLFAQPYLAGQEKVNLAPLGHKPVALAPDLGDTETNFTRRVKANFAAWDSDHDGKLSPEELSKRMSDPTIHGDDAAALATLRVFSRSGETKPFLCSLESLRDYSRLVAAKRRTPWDLDKAFQANQARIKSAFRQLYAAGAPHRDKIRQRSGGDCYFLSVVGAMISRNPDDLRSLIQEGGDGVYTVELPNSTPVLVHPPTDAELAVYTDDSSDGMWLFVLQRAYIFQTMSHHPTQVDPNEPLEMLGRGGSPATVLELMTGQASRGIALQPPPAQIGAVSQRVRGALQESLVETKKLVLLSTGTSPVQVPPGIAKGHIMAVVDYDKKTDTVTVWNPWGNTLRPKAKPPLGGYPTSHGVFQLPVRQLVQYFAYLTLEK